MPEILKTRQRRPLPLTRNRNAPRPALFLQANLLDSILMSMKIISATRGMGKEAHDA